MPNQDNLIDQMGSALQSIHADKNDPAKDAEYWRSFALAMRRREAEKMGLALAFDEAVSCGRLQDILHRMTVEKLLSSARMDRRVYFALGAVVGVIVARFLE